MQEGDVGNEILNGDAGQGSRNTACGTRDARLTMQLGHGMDRTHGTRDIRHGTCTVELEMQGKGSGTMDAGQGTRNREHVMWDMGCRTMDLGPGNRVCASGDMRQWTWYPRQWMRERRCGKGNAT